MRKRAVLGERDRPMEGSANLRRTRESEGAKESERDNIRDGGRERERERERERWRETRAAEMKQM